MMVRRKENVQTPTKLMYWIIFDSSRFVTMIEAMWSAIERTQRPEVTSPKLINAP